MEIDQGFQGKFSGLFMLNFKQQNRVFNMRSVAVIIRNQHLLIHRSIKDDFWALPGGRVEFFENSDATLVREMCEELGCGAQVQRLLWYVENFFHYENQAYHEISTYHLVEIPDLPFVPYSADNPAPPIRGLEDTVQLEFIWVPLDGLANWNIKPDFLIESCQHLPTEPTFIKIDQLELKRV